MIHMFVFVLHLIKFLTDLHVPVHYSDGLNLFEGA